MKNLLASKTVWFNIIVGIVGVLALPEFISVFPPELLKYAVFVGAVGNFILRVYFTKTAII